MSRKKIGIIGFGPTGLSFLAQLLEAIRHNRQSPSGYLIFVFDPDKEGLGDAYREQPAHNLMNTSVEVTSLFADKPDDFKTWLNENPNNWKPFFTDKQSFTGKEIVPRLLFGRYLVARRKEILKSCSEIGLELNFIRQSVADLISNNGSSTLITESGEKHEVDYALIFTGNFKRSSFPQLQESPGFISSTYESPIDWNSLAADPSVLVLGTKLSGIDTILKVASQCPTAKLVAASRTGELPAPNHSIDLRNSRYHPLLNAERVRSRQQASPSSSIATILNDLVKEAWSEAGYPWDVDQFLAEDPVRRLHTQVATTNPAYENLILPLTELLETLWRDLGRADRGEILRRYFKIIMHFVGAFPVENAHKLVGLMELGRLQIQKDLVKVEAQSTGGFQASFANGSSQTFDLVIDASGYDNGLSVQGLSPLMKSIADKGYLALNGFGGLAVSSHFEVKSSRTDSTQIYSAGFPIKASVPFANWFNRIVAATHKIAKDVIEVHHAV